MNSATTMLAAGSGSGTNFLPLLLIAGLFILTYFMIIRPQSKRRRSMVATQSALGPGAEVVTIGGLYATVVAADDETVHLEIAPGVSARYARGAIAKVTTPAPAPDADDSAVEASSGDVDTDKSETVAEVEDEKSTGSTTVAEKS
ncbi:MAG: preprotein translocase subunit YajC [Mycobacteriales bacterium]